MIPCCFRSLDDISMADYLTSSISMLALSGDWSSEYLRLGDEIHSKSGNYTWAFKMFVKLGPRTRSDFRFVCRACNARPSHGPMRVEFIPTVCFGPASRGECFRTPALARCPGLCSFFSLAWNCLYFFLYF
jgi:hypothetical protein